MADNETGIAGLSNNYYRDSFGKLMLIIVGMIIAIVLLLATSFYIYLSQPAPIHFSTSDDWRVQPDVALDQPYLDVSQLLQWVNDAMLTVFHYDFINYNRQLKTAAHYFTDDGWRVFLNQLNNHANYNDIQNKKLFINSRPEGAPIITNEGVLSGRYAWWIEVPITLNYVGNEGALNKTLTLRVLVVRVPTLNNLMGVGIDNVIVAQDMAAPGGGNQ